MANNENLIPIPGRLHSVATEGHVAGADEIYDDTQQKDQGTINSELIAAVGTGGSVDSKIAAAKTEIIGDAATDYNTLGKLEDKIQAEATRAEAAEEALDGRVDTLEEAVGTGGSVDSRISAAVATETTRAQAAEADRYTKAETYNKTELNNMITTPNQEYVSVIATAQTTAVTDVLPATGAADTTYRVGNWDGTQYNDSVFSEYAWNGSAYIKLSTKSQVGEVYDISINHADTKYADLKAALGTNGANIPQSLRKGGMSVKFIQSSDNKYVQARLMADSFTTDTTQWQGVDTEPKIGSKNLIESNGVYQSLQVVDEKWIYELSGGSNVTFPIDNLPIGIYRVSELSYDGNNCYVYITGYNGSTAVKNYPVVINGEIAVADINRNFDSKRILLTSSNQATNIKITLTRNKGLVYDIDGLSKDSRNYANLLSVFRISSLGGNKTSTPIDIIPAGDYKVNSAEWTGSGCDVVIGCYNGNTVVKTIPLVTNDVVSEYIAVGSGYTRMDLYTTESNAATDINVTLEEVNGISSTVEKNVNDIDNLEDFTEVKNIRNLRGGSESFGDSVTLLPGTYIIEKATWSGSVCDCVLSCYNNGAVVYIAPLVTNNTIQESFVINNNYELIRLYCTSSNTANEINVLFYKNDSIAKFIKQLPTNITNLGSIKSEIDSFNSDKKIYNFFTAGGSGTSVQIPLLSAGTYRIVDVKYDGSNCGCAFTCYQGSTLKKALTFISADVIKSHINVPVNNYDSMYLYCGNGQEGSNIYVTIEKLTDNVLLNNVYKPFDFTGKSILIVGDSIAAGYIGSRGGFIEDCYIKLFKDKVGAGTLYNYSEGGGGFVLRDGMTVRTIEQQLERAYDDNILANVDFIFVNAGTNDYGSNQTAEAFIPALESAINYINQYKKASANVIFITPFNRTSYVDNKSDKDLNYFRSEITKRAILNSFSVVNGAECGIPGVYSSYSGQILTDDIHPNALGHKLIANALVAILS